MDPWPVLGVKSMVAISDLLFSKEELLELILSKDLKFPKNVKISEMLQQLISGMLEREPDQRLDHMKLNEIL